MERWVTFDCYGTLVDWRAGIRGELGRLLPGVDPEVQLGRYFALEASVQRDGGLAYREVLAQALAGVAGEVGVALPDGERDALGRSLPGWPVFPDTRTALGEARARGWRLAILSNTDRDLLEASVAAIGVPFDETVVASEIGSYKPAARHWHVFRELTGCGPGGQVHVAQSLFHDVGTANELGIPSVWVNRLGEEPGPVPTREIPGLAGLADVLDELVPAG